MDTPTTFRPNELEFDVGVYADRALTVARHLLSILLLPFVMVVLMPRWLTASWWDVDTRWASGEPLTWAARAIGVAVFAAGFALFAWCVSLFARVGRGTLAPWDPTRRLVAVGPYRYLRNPMITGVVTMLVGEALVSGSRVLAGWAVTFFAFNYLYFMLVEEPGLERRFGADYTAYKSAVPRWLPRSTPWSTEGGDRARRVKR